MLELRNLSITCGLPVVEAPRPSTLSIGSLRAHLDHQA